MSEPHGMYEAARRQDGLTFVPALDAWLVSRYDDVRAALRDTENFSSAIALRPGTTPDPAAFAELAKAPGGGPIVVSTDGELHLRLRAPLTRALSGSRVQAVLPYVRERAEALADAFAGDDGVELMGAFARPLPAQVIAHMIGLDPEESAIVIAAGARAEELLFRPLPVAEQVEAAREVAGAMRIFDGLVERRTREPRDDIASELIAALGEPTPETRATLVSNLQNLLLAGHVTTTSLIGTAVLNLLRHREQWELLCERPSLIPAAVEEAARFEAPVQGTYRLTTRPVTFAGTDLPAGAAVLLAFGSAGRDENRYERAGEFDITRAAERNISFGHGVHACPGSQLGREEARIALEVLTRRFPGLRPASDEPVEMLPTLVHRSPRELRLTW
ncbi:cytochrome P450 [Bailinhaonella thermotolerans]|uniref:Cytochrome P450 n=1 Tax=Bailinhaonella thermotolerans TaxID=1070861 RepID=A0A3A4A4J4_9ACTN|nr:cytochrome P450 [Bailinhaonella thermotolerans]RJL22616.1 cytochrome P450 [Bailinhaonella thermotolerans]